MYLGIGLFAVALGAVLRYGVADQVEGVDLATVGLIVMLAGAVAAVVGLFLEAADRRRVSRTREVQPTTGGGYVERQV